MAPKSPSQFEEIRERSKEKILQTALKCFAEHGYDATSIARISREAGVSKGLMYNYFHSKEDLLYAVLNQAFEHGDELAQTMMQAQSPQDRIGVIIEQSFQWALEHAAYSKMMISLSLQVGKFPKVQEMINAKVEGMRGFYVHLFCELGFENPEMEAYTFGAMMDGLSLQNASVGDKIGFDRVKQFLLDKYCNKNKKTDL